MKPKVLVFDIETAPIRAHVWGLWENNVALNQIEKDWHILSWSAKWLDEKDEVYKKNRKPDIMYADQRKAPNVENDKKILKKIWKLLDESDVVLTKNGIRFDSKKLNARFALMGLGRPSPYKHIDMEDVVRKHFSFTSAKLEYLTDKLCTRYKKKKHKKFPGHEMWDECLKGNKAAWEEMEEYNRYDVLSLEELYYVLIPWVGGINFNLFHDDEINICKCGSKKFNKKGFAYTDTGKFQRYKCKKCGAPYRGNKNLLDKEKRKSLLKSL